VGSNFRTYNPKQPFLLPPSPLEWLPEGHLGYFVLEVIETLDLRAIEEVFDKRDARGERPYSPRMMLGVIVYGYCVGIFSSRKLARATYEDVAFRVLSAGEHPHFTRINDFRLEHQEALAGLFVQVLKLCQRAGLVKLGHVALDGTKIHANASKHKAMSYERMKKEEQRLKDEVAALLAQADAQDAAEDARFGKGQSAHDLPEELRRRQSRIERIAQAKAELESEAAQTRAHRLRELAKEQQAKSRDPSIDPKERKTAHTRAEQSREQAKALDKKDHDDDDDSGPSAQAPQVPRHHTAAEASGKPTPKAQRNFTDPESKIMVKGGEFLQGYNAQAVVDAHAQIILAPLVTNQAADGQHLPIMLELTRTNAGELPVRLSADSGYCSVDNIAACEQLGVDAYLALGREKKRAQSTDEQSPKLSESKEKMRAKLATDSGRAVYSRRKVIVEPVFGQIKAAQGFRHFSQRGLRKVRNEWSLVCMTHNLLKLFRFSALQHAPV
jgi:transposase